MPIDHVESATSGTDRTLSLGIVLLVVAYLTVSIFTVCATRWIQDDTMIFLQYARNLANGDGLVFNVGERVCGITSPLWTLLLAPAFLVAENPVLFAAALSLVFGAGVLVLLVRLFDPGERSYGGLAAAGALLLAPLFRIWAISGMETSLFLLLILLSLKFTREKRMVPAGVVVGLCMLTRPEGYFLALACLTALLVRRVELKEIRKAAVIATAIVAPWIVFSWAYYGSPIPQSLLAKKLVYGDVLFRTDPFTTLRTFLAAGPIPLAFTLVGAVGFLSARKHWRRDIDVLLFAALYLAFFVAGRTFIHDWYMPPIVLVQAYGIGLAAVLMCRIPLLARVRRAAGLAAVLLVCVSLVPLGGRVVDKLREKQEYIDGTLRRVADFSRVWPREGPVFVNAIGYVGYYGERYLIDSLGLVSPQVLPSYASGDWVEPIMQLSPEIVVLGPTAGTATIVADPWFQGCYHEETQYSAPAEIASRGGTFEKSYRMFVRRRGDE